MSMLVMVNQKFREGVPGWTCFHAANEVRGRRGFCGRAWGCDGQAEQVLPAAWQAAATCAALLPLPARCTALANPHRMYWPTRCCWPPLVPSPRTRSPPSSRRCWASRQARRRPACAPTSASPTSCLPSTPSRCGQCGYVLLQMQVSASCCYPGSAGQLVFLVHCRHHHAAASLTLPHPAPPCLQSLEDEAVRAQVLRLVSLPLWHALSRGRLQLELHDQPQVKQGRWAGGAAGVGVRVVWGAEQACKQRQFPKPFLHCCRALAAAGEVCSVALLSPHHLTLLSPLTTCPHSWPSTGSTWPSARPRQPRRRDTCRCSSALKRHSCRVRAARRHGHCGIWAACACGGGCRAAPTTPLTLQQGLLSCFSFPPPPLPPLLIPRAGLLSEFLEVLQGIVPAPMDVEGGEAAATEPAAQLDKQALLYCERFVEFLTDLLSQA